MVADAAVDRPIAAQEAGARSAISDETATTSLALIFKRLIRERKSRSKEVHEPARRLTQSTSSKYDNFMTKVLDIDECHFLSQGTVKLVYAHPAIPDGVIKLVKPTVIDEHGQFLAQPSWKKKRKLGIYRFFQREIDQYLRICRSTYPYPTATLPVAAPIGLIQTSAGLGLISEIIRGPDGKIAPTLDQLVRRNQFSAVHKKALEAFFERCIDLHVVFGEVNASGLLFTKDRSAEAEFVLVDGIGEKNFIPLKTWFFGLNRRRVLRVREQIFDHCRKVARERSPVRLLHKPSENASLISARNISVR